MIVNKHINVILDSTSVVMLDFATKLEFLTAWNFHLRNWKLLEVDVCYNWCGNNPKEGNITSSSRRLFWSYFSLCTRATLKDSDRTQHSHKIQIGKWENLKPVSKDLKENAGLKARVADQIQKSPDTEMQLKTISFSRFFWTRNQLQMKIPGSPKKLSSSIHLLLTHSPRRLVVVE